MRKTIQNIVGAVVVEFIYPLVVWAVVINAAIDLDTYFRN